MRKLKFILILIAIIGAVLSCEKARISEIIRDEVPYDGIGIPIFEQGNISCDDVELADGLVQVFPFSTGRINFENGVFDGIWPKGLEVNVRDNTFIDFFLTDEADYCVGSVIVKGGNGSIVYKYSAGVRSDIGLTSPLNASGNPANLSNLTFCFVKCPEDLVIAVKVWYNDGSLWGATTGENVFLSEWCGNGYLGINPYPFNESIVLERSYSDEKIGLVSLIDGKIKITLNTGLSLTNAYIYIGSKEELTDPANLVYGCPDYSNDWIHYIDW